MIARPLLVLLLLAAAAPARAQHWVTSWAGAVQGPWPTGAVPAEPSLRFAFPAGQTGARHQTFRLIVMPSMWGNRVRIRLSNVIWSEGMNDFGADGGATAEQVEGGMTAAVKRIRDKFPGVKVLAATLPGTAGTVDPHRADLESRRRAFNVWLRGPNKVFDGVIDFEAAVTDPATGGLRPEFVPGSTVGGTGDGLHPNRAGYLAMGDAIDLRLLRAPPVRRPRPPPPSPAPKPADATDATE